MGNILRVNDVVDAHVCFKEKWWS